MVSDVAWWNHNLLPLWRHKNNDVGIDGKKESYERAKNIYFKTKIVCLSLKFDFSDLMRSKIINNIIKVNSDLINLVVYSI